MKYFLLPLILTGLPLSGAVFGQIVKSSLLAGAATVNITPRSPLPMSGYANRDELSKGVHDEIFARAIVFDDGKNKACIVQADLIGFSFDVSDDVSREIEKRTGIPGENCMLVAVHNHGAPSTGVYGEGTLGNLDAYLESLKQNLVDVAIEAYEGRMPARVGFGKGSCTMNINRRARHSEGGIWLGRNPDGPCDHDVDVVRINSITGDPIGILVNWPCHATVGGQDNYQITGDWPGAAVRYVREKLKPDMTVSITAGASADINPIYGPNNRFGDIDAVGLVLGEEIVKVIRNISSEWPGAVRAVRHEIDVPGKKKNATRMPGEKMVAGEPVKLRFSVIKVGPVVFAGISGELMTTIGMSIKAKSPFSNTIVMTHCNGSSGYLCTDEAYKEGGYEPMVSRTMPGVERIIVDEFMTMFGEL